MKLLELRARMKKKKPRFIRQVVHKKSKLKKKWRKPRGSDSKVGKRGHIKKVSRGYGSPKKIKYLTKDGLKAVLIKSMNDLSIINKEKECAIVSSALGNKKRIEILKEAQKQVIKIINIKKIDEYIKKIEEKLQRKKEEKKKKEKVKKEKEKKVKDKKDGLAEKLTDEEKKEKDKKEKDKLLTKREVK